MRGTHRKQGESSKRARLIPCRSKSKREKMRGCFPPSAKEGLFFFASSLCPPTSRRFFQFLVSFSTSRPPPFHDHGQRRRCPCRGRPYLDVQVRNQTKEVKPRLHNPESRLMNPQRRRRLVSLSPSIHLLSFAAQPLPPPPPLPPAPRPLDQKRGPVLCSSKLTGKTTSPPCSPPRSSSPSRPSPPRARGGTGSARRPWPSSSSCAARAPCGGSAGC